VYNKGVNYLQNNTVSNLNKLTLRNKFVTKIHDKTVENHEVEEWELNTPKTIRQQAIFELVKKKQR
jgi:hypothetical protein